MVQKKLTGVGIAFNSISIILGVAFLIYGGMRFNKDGKGKVTSLVILAAGIFTLVAGIVMLSAGSHKCVVPPTAAELKEEAKNLKEERKKLLEQATNMEKYTGEDEDEDEDEDSTTDEAVAEIDQKLKAIECLLDTKDVIEAEETAEPKKKKKKKKAEEAEEYPDEPEEYPDEPEEVEESAEVEVGAEVEEADEDDEPNGPFKHLKNKVYNKASSDYLGDPELFADEDGVMPVNLKGCKSACLGLSGCDGFQYLKNPEEGKDITCTPMMRVGVFRHAKNENRGTYFLRSKLAKQAKRQAGDNGADEE